MSKCLKSRIKIKIWSFSAKTLCDKLKENGQCANSLKTVQFHFGELRLIFIKKYFLF
jgi:hypothetical protein